MSERDWPAEARARGIAAGYGDVLIGVCDVEGTYANGHSLCKNDHAAGDGPRIGSEPAIYVILRQLGVPTCSASCHWVGIDTEKMTPEQRAAVRGRRNWVNERWRDKHERHCAFLYNQYATCVCPSAEAVAWRRERALQKAAFDLHVAKARVERARVAVQEAQLLLVREEKELQRAQHAQLVLLDEDLALGEASP
jgi:hypothetical protein